MSLHACTELISASAPPLGTIRAMHAYKFPFLLPDKPPGHSHFFDDHKGYDI